MPPHAPGIDPHQYGTDDEVGSPYDYSPTHDHHYTHSRPYPQQQPHGYGNVHHPPPVQHVPINHQANPHPQQYYYLPPPPPMPPIAPHNDPFQEPRSQDYYGGHGGTGRYYQHREREATHTANKEREKEHRRRPSPLGAAQTSHAPGLKRNDSSGSSLRGELREKERKQTVEKPDAKKKSSLSKAVVEKCNASVTSTKDKSSTGNPLRELEQLKFTPKVTAGAHMRRFERLVGLAYPGVSSGGKWNIFIKTLDYPGLWSSSAKTTPGRWAMDLNKKLRTEGKTENASFEHLKSLFIERWGTREEREQLQSSVERKKEKDKERQERDRHYLHQQLINTAESLPKNSSKRSELVVHHEDDHPSQVEAITPVGGDVVVTIKEDKLRKHKEKSASTAMAGTSSTDRHREVKRDLARERDLSKSTKSSSSRSRNGSTPPKSVSRSSSSRSPPSARSSHHSSRAPSAQAMEQHQAAWGNEEPAWGNPEKSGWEEGSKKGNSQQGWSSGESGGGGGVQWDLGDGGSSRGGGGSGGSNGDTKWGNGTGSQKGGGENDWNQPPLSNSPRRKPSPLRSSSGTDNWGSAPGLQTPPPNGLQDGTCIISPTAELPTSSGSTPSLPRSRALEGKVAAITGASRGIGRAIALGFAREGAHIVAHYWGTVSDPSNDDIVSLATEIRSMGQRCEVVFGDISDPDTSHNIVQKAIEEFGKLDIGVGNAGMCWFRDFWDITPELMRRHIDVNMNGNMWFVQACARQMKAQYVSATKTALDEDNWAEDGDHITDIPDHSLLLVSSTTSMTASPAAAHYAASSAGIVSLVQSMAVELGKYGIRCNALLPGTVMTRMVKEGVEDVDRRRGMERRVPLLGKLGRPRDVVGPAVFLAGEQSRYVTGTKLVVDGGASAAGGGGW